MRFRTLACSFAVLGLVAVAANAGTMTPTLQVMNRYDLATQAPLPIAYNGPNVANGQPGLYEVGVFFTAQKEAATEKGWLSTAFGTGVRNNFGSNLTLDGATGWFPNTQQTDINGPAIGGAKAVYQTNQDAGTPNDLQGIIAALESATIAGAAQGGNAFELRNELGTAGAPNTAGYKNPLDGGAPAPATGNPSYLGSFFVSWNGTGFGSVDLQGLQYAFSLLNGTPTTATDDTPGTTTTVGGIAAAAHFGIPEPATMSLFGLGMIGMLGLIRRRS
jgi:hypothetical protein